MLLLPMLLSPAGVAYAQVWHHGRLNELKNIRSGSVSPVATAGNPSAGWHAVQAGWNYEKGDFHRADASSGKSELSLGVEEIEKTGKFSTAGHASYFNTKEFDRNWNSLLGNDPDNPYIICDTLADNSVTERFDIGGTVVWDFAPGWLAGASVGLLTGTLSDNKDPRPKNDVSRIPVLVGVERTGTSWSAGFFGGAELFRSEFKYHIEDGLKAYRYYKMMGMGEFFAFSSSESASAPREYAGSAITAGANATLKFRHAANFTELAVKTGKENARDGGSAYEWKGGDYSFMHFLIHDRLDLSGRLHHSLTLDADVKLREGYWHDQKRMVDTEHGNITYFDVLSRYRNNDATRLSAGIDYRLSEPLEGLSSWAIGVGANFTSEASTHYTDGDPHTQQWSMLTAGLNGWKTFHPGRNLLDLSASVSVTLPMGDAVFDTGNSAPAKEDVTDRFVAPSFAYETSGKIAASLRADWVFPDVHGTKLSPGLFALGTLLKQTGSAPQYPAMEGSALYGLSMGAFMRF